MYGNGYGYGSPELLIGLLILVPILIGFFVLYLVVRWAVRDGVGDALKHCDNEQGQRTGEGDGPRLP